MKINNFISFLESLKFKDLPRGRIITEKEKKFIFSRIGDNIPWDLKKKISEIIVDDGYYYVQNPVECDVDEYGRENLYEVFELSDLIVYLKYHINILENKPEEILESETLYDYNYTLRWAAENNYIEIAKRVLQEDKSGKNYVNVLHLALRKDYIEMAKLLLSDKRINPAEMGAIAFEVAVERSLYEIVEILLKDPRLDPRSSEDFPLSLAVETQDLKMVEILLNDPRTNFKFALVYALDNNKFSVLNLIKKHPRFERYRHIYEEYHNIY